MKVLIILGLLIALLLAAMAVKALWVTSPLAGVSLIAIIIFIIILL